MLTCSYTFASKGNFKVSFTSKSINLDTFASILKIFKDFPIELIEEIIDKKKMQHHEVEK